MTNLTFDVRGLTKDTKKDFFKTDEFRSRPATEGQIGAYLRMCEQRDLEPGNYEVWNAGQISDEIDRLINMVTQNQLDLITRKVEELNMAGFPINMPNTDELTGGKDGSASSLINSLIDMQNQHHKTCAPYGEVLRKAVSWFYCPDIEWKEGVSKTIRINTELWRKLTPEEFADEIKANYTHDELHSVLRENQNKFFNWRKSLITDKMINYIRTLEDRLSDMSSSKKNENTWAVDQDGNLVQVNEEKKHDDVGRSMRGYATLDADDVQCLTKEQGQLYIDILEDALKNPATKHNLPKLVDEMDFELIRPNVSDTEKEEHMIEEVKTFLYSTFAMVGHNDEELEVLADNPTDGKFKKRFLSYIMEAQEQDLVEIEEIKNLADQSPRLAEIFTI